MSDTKITTHTDAHGHEQSAVRTGGKFSTKGDREGAAAPLGSLSPVDGVEELREQYRESHAEAERHETLAWATYAYERAAWEGRLHDDGSLYIFGESNDENSDPVFRSADGKRVPEEISNALYSDKHAGMSLLVETLHRPGHGYIVQVSDDLDGGGGGEETLLDINQGVEFPDRPKERIDAEQAKKRADSASNLRVVYRHAVEQMSIVGAFERASEQLGGEVDSIEFRPSTREDGAVEAVGDNGASLFLLPEDDDEVRAFQELGGNVNRALGADRATVRRSEDGWDITISSPPNDFRDRIESTTEVQPNQPNIWAMLPHASATGRNA